MKNIAKTTRRKILKRSDAIREENTAKNSIKKEHINVRIIKTISPASTRLDCFR